METTTSLAAALAGAAIHILTITPVQGEEGTNSFIITFEFQYKSRGNYVWGSSVHTAPAHIVIPPADTSVFKIGGWRPITAKELCGPIIAKAVEARSVLEDPDDQGRYNYLELES